MRTAACGPTPRGNGIYAVLGPPEEDPTSIVLFAPEDRAFAEQWVGTDDPAIAGRLAPIARTGGDGSWAALWRDDGGAVRVVHLPSGSGSTMLCTLADDPVDFLRLVAIGYEELCWPDLYAVTPEAAFANAAMDQDPSTAARGFVPPACLREWVEDTFGLTVPRIGAELVPRRFEMGEDGAEHDPFVRWLAALGRL